MRVGRHNKKFVPPKYTSLFKYMSEGWDTQNMRMRGFLESEKALGDEKNGDLFLGD